jgi:hypothetical protein
VLERREFELLAKRYAEHNAWPEDSEQSQNMHAFLMMWWEMLEAHCDADGDGRLTPDEFIEAFDARDDAAIDGGGAVIFDAFDTDRSGTISVEEYRRFLLIYGMDAFARRRGLRSLGLRRRWRSYPRGVQRDHAAVRSQ